MKKCNKLQGNNSQKDGMKELKKMELEMVMELSITNKAENIRVTGTTIKWMVMELYITLMEESPIKANGKVTLCMVKVF